jgi:hypothetical protein
MVTPGGDIIVPAGTYTISIGAGQPDSGQSFVSGRFSVSRELKLAE